MKITLLCYLNDLKRDKILKDFIIYIYIEDIGFIVKGNARELYNVLMPEIYRRLILYVKINYTSKQMDITIKPIAR